MSQQAPTFQQPQTYQPQTYQPRRTQQFGRVDGGQQQPRTRSQARPTLDSTQQFSQAVSPEVTRAVEHLDRLVTVANFTSSRAMRRGNEEAALIADGIKEIAILQKEFLVESNPLVHAFETSFRETLQDANQRLQQYQQQPDVQELVTIANRTIDAVTTGIQSFNGST